MAPLPRSTPSDQGVDGHAVVAFLDAIEGVAGIEPHSVMLLRHGRVVAEGWWDPHTPETVQQLYSLSKSFTGTAVSMAVAEGLLNLDAPVISYFPELDEEVTDPRSRAILVRHIASMSAGHTTEQWDRALAADWDEPVRGFLLEAPDGTPGVTFAYSQSTTYTLAAIVQRVSGQTLLEYLRPRLFDPLGIGDVAWVQHPEGRDLGFAGMQTTTEDLARFGQLYLQGGVWEGRQLVDKQWIAEATRVQTDTAGTWAEYKGELGYGYQFWISRHGYRGDGAYGQFCVVLPEHDAVFVMTAETENMRGVMDEAWTRLLPAFGARGTGSPDADTALARRLTGLRLPFPDGGEITAAAEFSAARTDVRALERVHVAPGELTLHEADGTATTLPLITGRWPVRQRMAARAAQTGPHTIEVHVQFVEAQHKLRLVGDLRAGTFDASWRTWPLMAPPYASLSEFAHISFVRR